MLETQTDTLLLSKFHSETEVGWYGAATTIAYSLVMLSQAYRFSVYPLMSRYAVESSQKLAHLYQTSFRFLSLLVFPMTVGLSLLSPQIVPFIFGSQFGPTVPILAVLAFTLVFTFLNEPNIRVMLVNDKQSKLLFILVISVLINILINFILIPSLAGIGSAIARVCSVGTLFMLTSFYANKILEHQNAISTLLKPLIASSTMGLILYSIRSWPLLISITCSVVVYIVFIILLQGITNSELKRFYLFIKQQNRYFVSL